MLNVAVIGIGAMGKNHARVYDETDNVNLVAVADPNEKDGKKIAKKCNCKWYPDYKEMIKNEKIDLVSVVIPTQHHSEVAVYCLNKKISCLVEKPIASTVEDAKKVISAAEKSKAKLMIGHIERFNPAIIELKKRLDNGELGKVFKIDVNRVGPFPSRIRDVGVVIDLATHDIDIMRYLTGSEVSRLYAETEKKIHTSNEDLLSGLLKFKNDAICNLNINWLTPTKIRKLYITGQKGMFVADYLKQDLHFFENAEMNNFGLKAEVSCRSCSSRNSSHLTSASKTKVCDGRISEIKNGIEYADIMRGVSEGTMMKFFINKKEPLRAELEHFIDCVSNGKKPLISGDDGLEALRIAIMLIDSAKDKKVIHL